MSFRDILLLLDERDASEGRLDFAARLAQRHDAHLSGACLIDPFVSPHLRSGIGLYGGEALARELDLEFKERVITKVAGLQAQFQDALRREGLNGEWHGLVGSGDINLTGLVRTSDIAIFGQVDPKEADRPPNWELIESTLLNGGRPILLVPCTGAPSNFGEAVLIAWNGSREAARAANDALPLLQHAKSVTVFTVSVPDVPAEYIPGADMAVHLARHDVAVTTKQIVSAGLEVSDLLLEYAAENGIDCIVAGGYGHSRVRELILGGATRGLLRHMTVPVLLSN